MSATNEIMERNREVARKINEEARANPNSPYAGKLVGIANGQVVVVTDNWDDLDKRLREAEPDSQKIMGLEASRDYSVVHYIWELR
jgi:hypothetical protein